MKSKYLRLVVFILFFTLVMTKEKIWYKFFSKSRLYDVRYNEERKKRGILLLPEDWICRNKAKASKVWEAPDKDSLRIVYHSMKIVVVGDDGEIDHELDDIVKLRDGANEVVQIFSYYDSRPKVFIYAGSSREDTITKLQTDSILQAWKFKQ